MGAIIRRGKRHAPRFYAQYRDANGVRRSRLLKGATTAAEAHELLNAIERNLSHGQVGIKLPTAEEQARARVTIGDLSVRFLKEYAPPRIKSIEDYRTEARSIHKVRLLPTLKARPAAEVTTADVEKLRDSLTAGNLSAASVVQALAALSKLYEWARKVGAIACLNPVHGVERPRALQSFDYLDRDEVRRLLAHALTFSTSFVGSPEMRTIHPMVATALYCGMRKGELYGLTWPNVHLDAARIDVVRSYRLAPKSGLARHVPMHPELMRILRAWEDVCPPSKDGLVFPLVSSRGSRMAGPNDHRGLAELLHAARCHVPDKPWHALRHTFASHAVMSGTPLYDVQQLLGHSTPMMTQRYAHLAPNHLASAVARLSFAPPVPAGVADFAEEKRKRAEEGAADVQATYSRQHDDQEQTSGGGKR